MATRIIDRVNGTVTTTSTAYSTLLSYAMPENSVAAGDFHLVGRASSGTVAIMVGIAGVRRSTGNAVIPVSSQGASPTGLTLNFVEDGLGGANVVSSNSTTSGTDLIVQVSGAAGITMEWFGDMTLTVTST